MQTGPLHIRQCCGGCSKGNGERHARFAPVARAADHEPVALLMSINRLLLPVLCASQDGGGSEMKYPIGNDPSVALRPPLPSLISLCCPLEGGKGAYW
ncbi:hypothetical protein CDAR_89931 [Caerostris darwini]|uniref:Uncharacterized protein n=1 Tax=Caerostris darwini TaxID=1538125 RepID=A0AAV4RIC6_9ARAC|nr:hypothetical protein CDAR_89931 [Caerostris darwini]